MLAQAPVAAQRLIGRDLHFALRFVTKARPFDLDLAVRQLDPARLRSVMADLAAGLARRACAGDLLGAQGQDLFQGLLADLMDHGLHHLAGVLDQVHDGKQDLPVGLTELLDHSG